MMATTTVEANGGTHGVEHTAIPGAAADEVAKAMPGLPTERSAS